MKLKKHSHKVIIVLAIVAVILIVVAIRIKPFSSARLAKGEPPRPLPELTTATSRLASYTAAKGDIKYRVVPKPTQSIDEQTGWNQYSSKEYGFSFIYPLETQIESTETLGYQLPPKDAFKGSRDNFEIKITNKRGAFFILFMNSPSFSVASTTITSTTPEKNGAIQLTKQILKSENPKYSSSEIITYSFEKNNKKFVWYGTFDDEDFESINQFQSIVKSMKFK